MNAAARLRPRLLVLTSTFPRWKDDAVPPFVLDLSAALTRDFDVTVLAPHSRGAERVEEMRGVTVRRFRYAMPSSLQRLADGAILPNIRRNRLLAAQVPMFVLAELAATWSLVRGDGFDAIHAHWTIPQGWVAGVMQRIKGLPYLATTHGADMYALRQWPLLRAKGWALRSAERVTAVSASIRGEVLSLGVEPDRVSVLPMGVDTSAFHPDRRDEALRAALGAGGPLLLFVGRLVEKKGARFLIEAMPSILRRQPEAHLAIVGEGPERRSLEQLVARLGLTGTVTFLGPLPHGALPAYFASADVFVGPSVIEPGGDTEAFGVVFAEAMASGCPVVATDVGGVGDLIEHGRSGVLVPPRDLRAIAEAALELIEHQPVRDRVRTEGLARVRERFDQRQIFARYAQLVEETLAA